MDVSRDAAVRMEARRSILQLSAGLDDVFGLRLSQPPDWLLWMQFEGIDMDLELLVAHAISIRGGAWPASSVRSRHG